LVGALLASVRRAAARFVDLATYHRVFLDGEQTP